MAEFKVPKSSKLIIFPNQRAVLCFQEVIEYSQRAAKGCFSDIREDGILLPVEIKASCFCDHISAVTYANRKDRLIVICDNT